MSDCGHYEYLQNRAARVAARNPHLARKIMGLPPAYAAPKEHRIEVDCRTGERKVSVLTEAAPKPAILKAKEPVRTPPLPLVPYQPAFAFVTHREAAKDIIRAVAKVWDVNAGRLVSPDRSRRAAFPRFAAMWLIRDRLGLSQASIGKLIFARDHTSVRSSIMRAIKLHESDDVWRDKYDATVALLNESAGER